MATNDFTYKPLSYLIARPVSSDEAGSPRAKIARLASPARPSLARSASGSSIVSDSSISRQMRASTQTKSTDAHLARELALSASASKPKAPRAQLNVRPSFTQKELLQEALRTEEENARWIEKQRLDATAKEQQKEKAQLVHSAGFKRFISRRGSYPTITFSDYESMPAIFKLKPLSQQVQVQVSAVSAVTSR